MQQPEISTNGSAQSETRPAGVRELATMASTALIDSEMVLLIELYREQENLYDINRADYFDRQKTRESLQFICRAMGKNWTGE